MIHFHAIALLAVPWFKELTIDPVVFCAHNGDGLDISSYIMTFVASTYVILLVVILLTRNRLIVCGIGWAVINYLPR